jgi:uncharacterized phage protein (TIGR01671 family)
MNIKFRIYNKVYKNMVYYTLNDLLKAFIMEQKWTHHNIANNIRILIDIIKHDDTTPQMQYTGKQDINGVDIYEDDIIYKEILSWGNCTFYGATGVIKEDPHDFGWFIKGVDENDNSFYTRMGMNFEFNEIKVIGNIHENLNLLDE